MQVPDFYSIIGLLFPIIGIILFIYGIYVSILIIKLFPKAKMKKQWIIIVALVAIFLAGYIMQIYAVLAQDVAIQTMMQSVVYLLGAVFVVIIIQLSYRTYKLILESAED